MINGIQSSSIIDKIPGNWLPVGTSRNRKCAINKDYAYIVQVKEKGTGLR